MAIKFINLTLSAPEFYLILVQLVFSLFFTYSGRQWKGISKEGYYVVLTDSIGASNTSRSTIGLEVKTTEEDS